MNCENILSVINNNTNLITIIGIVISASVLLLQSFLQNRSNLKLQKENIKDDIKRKFHAEIEEAVTKASDLASDLASLLRNVYHIEYPSIRNSLDNGLVTNGFRTTTDNFMKLYDDTTRAAIDVIFVIEKYEIIQPEIKIFQTAINVALDDMREHYLEILREIMTFLPSVIIDDKGHSRMIAKQFPSVQQMNNFKKTYEVFEEALSHLSNWLYDFRIEIQNLLLGNLFNNKVPYRKPRDKKWLVITTEKENVKKLNYYFENETNFGRNKKRAEDDTKDGVGD